MNIYKTMKLLAATTNKGKIKEIERLFKDRFQTIPSNSETIEKNDKSGGNIDLEVVALSDLGITKDCPETGSTFLDNAKEKALFYSHRAGGMYTVGDDSGLVVEVLNGEPGVYSARYAGEPSDDEKNLQKLLGELKDKTNRRAKFVTVVALAKNEKIIASFTGEVHGEIIDDKRGTNGFGYDPIFYYPPLKKTFAQLSTETKNKISHRAAAFSKLTDFLSTLGNE